MQEHRRSLWKLVNTARDKHHSFHEFLVSLKQYSATFTTYVANTTTNQPDRRSAKVCNPKFARGGRSSFPEPCATFHGYKSFRYGDEIRHDCILSDDTNFRLVPLNEDDKK